LLGFFGNRGEHLGFYRLLAFCGLRHCQRGLAGLGKARHQLGQIAAFAEELAVSVDHFDIHFQVVFNLLRRFCPGLITDPSAGHAQQFAAQCLWQRTLSKLHALQRGLDEVRHRYEVFAQRFGQATHQGNAFGFDHAGHQPFQTLGWQDWQ